MHHPKNHHERLVLVGLGAIAEDVGDFEIHRRVVPVGLDEHPGEVAFLSLSLFDRRGLPFDLTTVRGLVLMTAFLHLR